MTGRRLPIDQLSLFELRSNDALPAVNVATMVGDGSVVPESERAIPWRPNAHLYPRSHGSPGGVIEPAPAYNPLVAALAQLVRDRWSAEQADRGNPLALRRVPSNMVIMAKSSSEEPPT